MLVQNQISVPYTSPFSDSHLLREAGNDQIQNSITNNEKSSKSQLLENEEIDDELITIIVKIPNKKDEHIVIHTGDDTARLIEDFSIKHKLTEFMKEQLRNNIKESLANLDMKNDNFNIENECCENISDDEIMNELETYSTNFMGNKMADRITPTKNKEACKDISGIISTKDTSLRHTKAELITMKESRSLLGNYDGTNNNFNNQMNVCERLYRNGLKDKQIREKKNERLKKEKEKLSHNFSFCPSINPLSKDLIKSETNCSRFEDRLITDQKNIKRIEYLKNWKIKELKRDCSFKPVINKYSEKLVIARIAANIDSSFSFSQNKFDKLFEDAKRKEINRENIRKNSKNEACTFRPTINSSSSFSSVHKLAPKKPRQSNLMVNQPSYRPKTGRGPRLNRSTDKTKIGNSLYSQNEVKIKLINDLREREIMKDQQLCNKSYVQVISDKLINNKKIENFKTIFALLDKDWDGKISKRSVSIVGIPKDIVRILSPILNEMNKHNLELSEKIFVGAACKLYDTLNLLEKDIILKYGNNKKQSSVSNNSNFSGI